MGKKLDVIRSVALPNQKRSIIAMIVGAGLAPGDFEWTDIQSEHRGDEETALLIKHRHRDYYFSVDRSKSDSWIIEFCPANETEWTKSVNVYWDTAVKHAKEWATRVAVEVADEDYVNLATASPQLLTLPHFDSEEKALTEQERSLLIQRLNEIETYVLGMRQGSEEFEGQVRTSLQFLKQHAEQSDRRSFYALVFSTLLAIGLTFLTPAETKQVIQHATAELNFELNANSKMISLISGR